MFTIIIQFFIFMKGNGDVPRLLVVIDIISSV